MARRFKLYRTIKQYETMDYSLFNYRSDNRTVNEKAVNVVAKSMRKVGSMLHLLPVVVDEEFNVIAGQHRLRACEKLEIPVIFTIEENEVSPKELFCINYYQTSWSVEDEISRLMKEGNKNMKRLWEISVDVGFKPAWCFYMGTDGKPLTRENIQSAKFGRSERDKLIEFVTDYETCEALNCYQTKKGISAFMSLRMSENFDIDTWVDQLERNRYKIKGLTAGLYLQKEFLECYNTRLSEEKQIDPSPELVKFLMRV